LRKFLSFFALTLLLMTGATRTAFSQLSQGGIPPSVEFSVPEDPTYITRFTPPSVDALLREDESSPLPYRFGVVEAVEIGIAENGYWTVVPDGGRIWRYTLRFPGAKALTVYFDRFRLPSGGRLFLYNADKSFTIGAFTSENNDPSGLFATELIPGEAITLEYYQPAWQKEMPLLHINGVTYAYRGISSVERGIAGPCEVNVNCPEGDDWQKQSRGVVRIQIRKMGGNFWCSGSVVNNTRFDHKPYVLTADHCGANADSADIRQWVFYFNYEKVGCPNSGNAPTPKSMTGAVMKAHGGNSGYTGSDFFLVLLDQNIPDDFNAYYNGWNRRDTTSPTGTGIHHPEGDVKKISTYTQPLISSGWQGGALSSHWKVKWVGTPNGHGVTEGGSSGSPIFDANGRIAGTLTGGDSNCDSLNLNSPDYYGKFAWHWDRNGTDSTSMLKYWLDPDNIAGMYLDGTAVGIPVTTNEAATPPYPNPFTGKITVKTGKPAGSSSISVSDISGRILFRKEGIPAGDGQFILDLGFLSEGIYFLQVKSEGQPVVYKIVKPGN
jgi:hypothetical protein